MIETFRGVIDSVPWLGQALESLSRIPVRYWIFAITGVAVVLTGMAIRKTITERAGRLAALARGRVADARGRMAEIGEAMSAAPASSWATTQAQREDLDFLSDSEAALRDAPSRGSSMFLACCTALVVTFFAWAYFAELEEVARGDGRVIPSSKMQVVQSLEGGIVKSIEAREGEEVKKGQVLLRIDDTGFSSDLGELQAKELSLLAQVARLRHEAGEDVGKDFAFSRDLTERAPDVVAAEKVLFGIRRNNLENQLNVLKERVEQKKLELAELQESQKRFRDGLGIARREFELKKPLADRGIVSKTDVLKLEREISDLKGQLATVEHSLPRAEAAIREAERLVEEQQLKFQVEAQTELNAKTAELAIVQQSLKGAKDKVRRTDIRSPVDGRINKLHVNTVGGVVRASEPLVEITPLEDNLQVEVKIKPSDIAFIRPQQHAVVKLTAYDFTIYGGLEGRVENISPDSTVDEQTKEIYYAVTIRTTESALRKGNESLPIIPGMVASVDIITGGKSVLDYILKPILKARYEAMRER